MPKSKKKPKATHGSKLNRPPSMGQNFLSGMPAPRMTKKVTKKRKRKA